jgi:hypothetical protein
MFNIIKGFLLPSVPNGSPVNEDRFIQLFTVVNGGSQEEGTAVTPTATLADGMSVFQVKINLRNGAVICLANEEFATITVQS